MVSCGPSEARQRWKTEASSQWLVLRVTEHGGRLSHAAVVARECGLPAVLGLEGACLSLSSGARIRVDGGSGTVTVLSQDSQKLEEKKEDQQEDEDMMDLSKSRDELIQSRNA